MIPNQNYHFYYNVPYSNHNTIVYEYNLIMPHTTASIYQPSINYPVHQLETTSLNVNLVNTTLNTNCSNVFQNRQLNTFNSSEAIKGYQFASHLSLYSQPYFPRRDNNQNRLLIDQYGNVVDLKFINKFDCNTNHGLVTSQTIVPQPLQLPNLVTDPNMISMKEFQLKILKTLALPQQSDQVETKLYQKENKIIPQISSTFHQPEKKSGIKKKKRKEKFQLTKAEKRKKNSEAAKRSRQKRKQREAVIKQLIAENLTQIKDSLEYANKLKRKIEIHQNAIEDMKKLSLPVSQ